MSASPRNAAIADLYTLLAIGQASFDGDHPYGVHLEQNADGVHVIETSDPPDLDAGVDGLVFKDEANRRRRPAGFVQPLEVRTSSGSRRTT